VRASVRTASAFCCLAVWLGAPSTRAADAADSGWSEAADAPPDTTEPRPSSNPPPAPSSPGSVPASPYEPAKPIVLPRTEPPPPVPEVPRDRPATLFDSATDYAIGGFGGLAVMYTRFANANAVQVCGEGGVILDHALTFGAGGCGIATMVDATRYGNPPHDPNDRLTFAYGGAIVRYHFYSRRIVNLGVGALIGAGGLSIGTLQGSGQDYNKDFKQKQSEAVFVLEPQVGGYLNITRWMRVGASAGYRIVSGVSTPGLSSSDVAGLSLGGLIQFGWF
jgi:hypothetical protein